MKISEVFEVSSAFCRGVSRRRMKRRSLFSIVSTVNITLSRAARFIGNAFPHTHKQLRKMSYMSIFRHEICSYKLSCLLTLFARILLNP